MFLSAPSSPSLWKVTLAAPGRTGEPEEQGGDVGSSAHLVRLDPIIATPLFPNTHSYTHHSPIPLPPPPASRHITGDKLESERVPMLQRVYRINPRSQQQRPNLLTVKHSLLNEHNMLCGRNLLNEQPK